MELEQGMLLDSYAQFVGKVEEKPDLTGKDAGQLLFGDFMRDSFQVLLLFPLRHWQQNALLCHQLIGVPAFMCQMARPWSLQNADRFGHKHRLDRLQSRAEVHQ